MIIKKKEGIHLLEKGLSKVGIKVKRIDENSIDIELKTAKNRELALFILSVYLVDFYAGKVVDEVNQETDLINGTNVRFMDERRKEIIKNASHLTVFTSILLNEYMRTAKTLNIDSFVLFNMPGFTEEAKAILGDEFSFKGIFEGFELDMHTNKKTGKIEVMKNEEVIHSDFMHILKEALREDEFFAEGEVMTHLNFIIELLGAKAIKVHSSVCDEIFEDILHKIKVVIGIKDEMINIERCIGCEACE